MTTKHQTGVRVMNLPKLKNTKSSGFSLVELLVVIGVITVLLAILLPTLSKARESANRTACGENLHSIYLALQMYVNENRRLPMPAVSASTPWSLHAKVSTGQSDGGAAGQPIYDTGRFCFRYIDTPLMFFCPSAQWLSPNSLDVAGIYPEAWPKNEDEFPDHEISGTYLLLLDAKRLQIGP